MFRFYRYVTCTDMFHYCSALRSYRLNTCPTFEEPLSLKMSDLTAAIFTLKRARLTWQLSSHFRRNARELKYHGCLLWAVCFGGFIFYFWKIHPGRCALRQTCPNGELMPEYCNMLVAQQSGSPQGKVNDCAPQGRNGFARIDLQFTQLAPRGTGWRFFSAFFFFFWASEGWFTIFSVTYFLDDWTVNESFKDRCQAREGTCHFALSLHTSSTTQGGGGSFRRGNL